MQDSHYSYIKKYCGDKAEMLLTNTDTLMYKIASEDFTKTSTKIKSYLPSRITQKIRNITIMQIN